MALYDVSTLEKKASPELIAGGTLYAAAPVGTILPFGGNNIPSGWGLCDGSAVSRTTYAELFAVIGTAFGAGDGSTTFNLPDMRESVPKGAGLTSKNVGAHLDADGLAVGEFLDDRVQDFTDNSAKWRDFAPADAAGWAFLVKSSSGTAVTGRFGATTEVKSVGVNYIICMVQAAIPADFLAKVDEVCSGKADKVSSATAGDIATLDANGNLADSGIIANEVLCQSVGSGDCNDFNLPYTLYSVDSNVANKPIASASYIIQVIRAKTGTSSYSPTYSQIAYRIGNTDIWRRYFDGTTWTSWEKLITESDLIVSANGNNSTATGVNVSSTWRITSNGSLCVCYGTNTEVFNTSAVSMTSMQLPSGYVYDYIISADVFVDGDTAWAAGASHQSGNGAGTYVTRSGLVNPGSFRQIVLAHKA